MPLIDERGQLFGRFNLVDALVAVVVIGLIPVAYGVYALFRPPVARLISVSPSTFYQGSPMRITIVGSNLRPFMRVSVGAEQGKSFAIESTTQAQVELPDLPAGRYDVVLWDYAQERGRLPNAVTILPTQPVGTIQLEVAGAFRTLSVAEEKTIAVGTKFPPTGPPLAEVLERGASAPARIRIKAGETVVGIPLPGTFQVDATLRIACYLDSTPDGSLRCMVPGPRNAMVVAPDSNLSLPGAGGWMSFQISEVHVAGPAAMASARIRFVVTSEALARIKVGDTDHSPKAASPAHSASIIALDGTRPLSDTALPFLPRLSGLQERRAGRPWILPAPLPGSSLRLLEAEIRVPVDEGPGGWTYKDEPFKIGAPFSFETPVYVIEGEVMDTKMPSPTTPAGVGQTR